MERPVVLFVCVKDEGKSQMAAALMRRRAGGAVEVHSAGTRPGFAVNALSAKVVAEVGASMAGRVPQLVDPALLVKADKVVVLGSDARVMPVRGMHATVQTWLTIDPTKRGVGDVQGMRLLRDDIGGLVQDLYGELSHARDISQWGSPPAFLEGHLLGAPRTGRIPTTSLARAVEWVRDGHPRDYGPNGYVPLAALLPGRDEPHRRP